VEVPLSGTLGLQRRNNLLATGSVRLRRCAAIRPTFVPQQMMTIRPCHLAVRVAPQHRCMLQNAELEHAVACDSAVVRSFDGSEGSAAQRTTGALRSRSRTKLQGGYHASRHELPVLELRSFARLIDDNDRRSGNHSTPNSGGPLAQASNLR